MDNVWAIYGNMEHFWRCSSMDISCNMEPWLFTNLSSFRTMFVADGSFCVAIVLSFFRLLYLCQASRHLGLVQLCMGKMIMVIWQFMFVAVVNLLGIWHVKIYPIFGSIFGKNCLEIEWYSNLNPLLNTSEITFFKLSPQFSDQIELSKYFLEIARQSNVTYY